MPGHGYGYRALARRRSAGPPVAAPPIGARATGFAIPPSAQWHPGQSAITLRADTIVTGYIAGKTLTVTALSGGAILEGQVLASGATTGTAIVKSAQSGGGNGGVGDYVVSVAQTVGSAGAPVGFTIAATQVASLADVAGSATLTSADGEGPRLMTDALGRRFLRFIAPYDSTGSWLQSLSLSGLDSYNVTAVAVGRVHVQGRMALVSLGAKALGTGQYTSHLGLSSNGVVSLLDNTIDYNGGSPPANINRLFAGMQMQALGSAIATDDGIGGSGGARECRVGVNEQSAAISNNTAGRATGVTGLEIGKSAFFDTNNNSAAYAYIDLYELALWTNGQMGTRAQMPARFDAAMAAAMGNFGIPAITDSLIFMGDSRNVNGTAAQVANQADGSGINVATLIGAPGSGLPASTRVLNLAVSGGGIGDMGNLFDRHPDNNNRATPVMASMMLGGGHDTIHVHSGINDLGGRWPTDTYSAATAGQADEMYGTNRSATFTATIADNDSALTATSVSGKIGIGSQVAFAGALSGLGVTGGGSPFYVNQFQSPAVNGVPATATLYSYKAVVERLLVRGFKVVWAREIAYGASETAGTIQLRARVAGAVADITADLGATLAANLRTYDLSQIVVGGLKVFGTDYGGGSPGNDLYLDGVHNTAKGKRLLVTGGDTPDNGILWNVTH